MIPTGNINVNINNDNNNSYDSKVLGNDGISKNEINKVWNQNISLSFEG